MRSGLEVEETGEGPEVDRWWTGGGLHGWNGDWRRTPWGSMGECKILFTKIPSSSVIWVGFPLSHQFLVSHSWTDPVHLNSTNIGYVQPKARAKSSTCTWTETSAFEQITDPMILTLKSSIDWWSGVYAVAQSGNECYLGSWVFLHRSTVHSAQGDIVVGCISDIVVPDAALSSNGAVTVKVFQVGDILHPDFEIPILKRSSPSTPRYVQYSACALRYKISGFASRYTVYRHQFAHPCHFTHP